MPGYFESAFIPPANLAIILLFILLAGAFPLKRWERGQVAPGFGKGAVAFAVGAAGGALLVVATLLIAWAAGDARPISGSFQDCVTGRLGIGAGWTSLLTFLFYAAAREETMMRAAFFLVPYWCASALIDLALKPMAKQSGDTKPEGGSRYCPPVPVAPYPFGEINASAKKIRLFLASAIFFVLLAGQSAFFSLMHSGNPHVNDIAFLNIAIAGLVLGLVASRSGGFYAAIGMHWVVNLTYEAFNLPISGVQFDTGFHPFGFELAAGGSAGGGAFGLEGGWAMTAVLSLAVISLLLWRLAPSKPSFSVGDRPCPDSTF